MSHISEFAKDPENFKGLQQDRLTLEIASLIYRTMKANGISRSKLAERLGVSKGRVTQYLCGERNLTLRTLADIFTAMQKTLCVRAADIAANDHRMYEVRTPELMTYNANKKQFWGGLQKAVKEIDEASMAA